MEHFVAYHSVKQMGRTLAPASQLHFLSRKLGLLTKARGNTVWIIQGSSDGKRTTYSLHGAYIADSLQEVTEDPGVYSIRGASGIDFNPPIPLNELEWFPALLKTQSNFSLGFNRVSDARVVEALLALLGRHTDAVPNGELADVDFSSVGAGNGGSSVPYDLREPLMSNVGLRIRPLMIEEEFGTVDDYVEAFEALEKEGLLPRSHKALMRAHFKAPYHTASWEQLAEDIGYAGGRAVNLQYGTLASRVARRLRRGVTARPRGFWLSVLAGWASENDSRGHTAFVLRREVIGALQRLGIIRDLLPHVSQESLDLDLAREVGRALALTHEERRGRLAQSPKLPEKIVVTTTAFLRNPNVIAEVLIRAHGDCEECLAPAPFFRISNGTPYLEVHHRKRLSDGGEDTVENAIALCPNCHRKAHHG